MSREFRASIAIATVFAAALALFAPVAHAGPPLICFPFDIGNARSLPWGGGSWHDSRDDYDLSRLAQDTLALLAPDTPVLVRMETLRRAVIYANKDPRAARELFARLSARAGESQGAGQPEAALPLFDYAYFIEAARQEGLGRAIEISRDQNGYEKIKQASSARGGDAQMEFAAALVASSAGQQEAARRHFANAIAGATPGSQLARNLVTHCHLLGIQAASLDELRMQVVAAKK